MDIISVGVGTRSVSGQVFGIPFAVTTDHREHALEWAKCLSPFDGCDPRRIPLEIDSRKEKGGWRLVFEGREAVLGLGPNWPRMDDLLRLLVVRERTDLVFVHASTVCTDDHALMFVGPSTSGKTTLALALREKGLRMLADDLTPINLGSGEAFTFITRPSIRPFTESRFGNLLAQDELADYQEARGIPIRAVFLLDAPRHNENRAVDAAGDWPKMRWLCTGNQLRTSEGRHSRLYIKRPEDFQCLPVLEAASQALTMKKLIRFSHPPHPRLSALLPQWACLVNRVGCWQLKPGYIEETVDLLSKAFIWLRKSLKNKYV